MLSYILCCGRKHSSNCKNKGIFSFNFLISSCAWVIIVNYIISVHNNISIFSSPPNKICPTMNALLLCGPISEIGLLKAELTCYCLNYMDKGYIFFLSFLPFSFFCANWYIVGMHKMFLDLVKFVQYLEKYIWSLNFTAISYWSSALI